MLSVQNADPARYRCGTKQLFLPEVPACATWAQDEAPQVEAAHSENLTLVLHRRNGMASRPSLMDVDRTKYQDEML